jgi:cytochrome c peroxidase
MKRQLFIFCLPIFFISCSVDPEIKPIIPVDNVKEVIPQGWPTPFYNFSDNPITTDKFILGRSLFYETMLSSDNTISCGSCHQQFSAFAQADHDLSHGVNGLLGNRNSPALQNLNWNTSFMHDGGINHIEVQPAAPITNPVEMNESLTNVVNKLSQSGKYRELFKKAYGDETVNTQRMFKTMALFMATMYSYNSKYDKVKRGEQSFSVSEQSGYDIFVQKCASCHKEPLFSDFEFRNNGLPVNHALNDSGRAHITRNISDLYKFKTPSLRNIEKTAPYMHDGRMTSLSQVLEHYNSGILLSPTLDPLLQSGSIPLTLQEKTDLLAFLRTLTDQTFLTDKRFADPN